MALRPLHHRPECRDIRSAFDSDRSWHSDYESDPSHRQSKTSSYNPNHTQSTSNSTKPAIFAPRVCFEAMDQGCEPPYSRFFIDREPEQSPRTSAESYASTVRSEDDVAEDDAAGYEVPECITHHHGSRAIPSTPSDFSELFPSHRRFIVRHDDSTLDGNMNIRLDADVFLPSGRHCDMTLFHLRMHDLRNRQFSLRRYCRDSGREVCHSARKPKKSSPERSGFQRSLSNTFNTIRSKSEQRRPASSHLKRHDSGYGSAQSSVDFDRDERPTSFHESAKAQKPVDVNSVKLEFSNYAQVEIRRAGAKASKRYEYEYWGTNYAWKRIVRKDSARKLVSYHLTKAGSEKVLAHISPLPLTRAEAEQELNKGGWIPPCSMWIVDDSLVRGQKDVADVVVASGLIALVDDSIRARVKSRELPQLTIPKLHRGVEYVGAKRLISEMFRRESSGAHSRHSSTSRPSSSHRS